MRMNIAKSINGVSIRFTEERWQHITLGHPELADYYYEILDTVENPEVIIQGDSGGLIAIRSIEMRKFIVVIYKELGKEGFIITAYLTNKIQKFTKKKVLWEAKK